MRGVAGYFGIRGARRLARGAVWRAGVAVVAATAWVPPRLAAQPVGLDDAALVDTLARRGMHDLLDRYAASHPSDDPAEALQLEVARLRLRASALLRRAADAAADDPARAAALRTQSDEAFAEMLQAQRTLAYDPAFADRRARAIWLTDLAEALLFERLGARGNLAAAFVEFGVPTAEQRAAVAAAMPEALSAMSMAERSVFEAQALYGRDPAARQQDQGSGLYDRLLDDYGLQRTPLYLAMAMHGTAMLPDEAPYFAQLGDTGPLKLPGQRGEPAEERLRLLQGAADRLDTFLAEDPGNGEDAARSLLGRVFIRLGRARQGIDAQLDPLIRSGGEAWPGLAASLGKALALADAGDFPAALEALDIADRHALVRDTPLYRLLATDTRYRVLRARADRADGADAASGRGEAYDAYFMMLNDPSLGAASRELRTLVYRRWAGDLEVGAAVDHLPPTVRMAVGEVARMKGQQALSEGDPDEASRWLRWAVRVNGALDDPAFPDAVRASGLFNGALAKALRDGGNVATLAEAVRAWTRVAEQFPQEPSAELAITYAADYAAALMQQASDHAAVRPLFEQTMRVLFDQYDTLDAAGRHRLFYAFTVFQQPGRYREAAAQYARVPFGHPRYFEAQALRLHTLERAYLAAEAADRDTLMRQTRAAAEQLLDEARPARRAAGEAPSRDATRAEAAAVLALAELDRAAGEPDAALHRLRDLEAQLGDTAGLDDLLRDALEKRILTLVGAGRLTAAADEAERMMARFPESSAGVITGVLTGLESQIDARRAAGAREPLRAEALEREAVTLAGVASTLARLLVDWAGQQGFSDAEMLAYHLPYVRALRVAGRPDEAAQYLRRERLLDAFPDDLGVLVAAGETHYALAVESTGRAGLSGAVNAFTLKDADAARAAAGYFDRILTGLQPPYPDDYWNAWLRRLALNLALGQAVDDIPLRIRQLADADPDLGGPDFKPRFEALAAAARRAR